MEAWLLAAADERVAAAAPAIGVQSFRFAVENDLWSARVGTILPPFKAAAKDMGKSEIDREVVESVWRRLIPGLADGEFDSDSTLPCIAPRPLLVVNGEVDPRCPLKG